MAGQLALRLAGLVLLGGCASYVPPPPAEEAPAFQERAETKQVDGVRVRAAVLSAEESREVFGAKLGENRIQPIWLEIENREEQGYVVMLLSIDPDYFSPAEAAWISRGFGERGTDLKVQHFFSQSIPVSIPPGATAEGYVFTNLDPGVKAFAVDLIGDRSIRRFDFLQGVPGFEADFQQVDFATLYPPEDMQDLDLDGLRRYLEQLPCCALGGDHATPGDPLNLVIVGDGPHVLTTLVARGWDLTETVTTGTAFQTAWSSVFGSRYRTSPISPLYLFDRPQDAGFQKARESVDERNHLRLWKAPVTLESTPVWIGQISRDIGVKLSSKTFVTHKIDPYVDEALIYLMLDVAASEALGRVGFVEGVGASSQASPRVNYTEDPYYTHGLRGVMILSDDVVPIDGIEDLRWERMPTRLRDQQLYE